MTDKPVPIAPLQYNSKPNKVFIDSNIWTYLFTEDSTRRDTAKQYISQTAETGRIVVSYQVINEVCSVLKKKKYTEQEIRQIVEDIAGLCEVCDFSCDIIIAASRLRERFSLSYWDSLIVSSALAEGCYILASEDMQDGLSIDDTTVRNVLKQ